MKAPRPLVTMAALLLALVGLTVLSAPAQATGVPAVRSLRVVSQVDHAAKVAWAAPDTSRVVARYRIAWGDRVVRLAPSARSYVVQGLRNGAATTVSVRPVYRSGALGDRRAVQAMGAAKPGTPGAPSLAGTDVNGGGQKVVAISWGPVAANGPAPVQYRVRRTSPSGTTVVCDWTTATSCSNTFVNDGAVHTFQVRARNAEATSARAAGHRMDYISPLGAGRSLTAYGPIGAVSLGVTTGPGTPPTGQWSFSIVPNGAPASWVLKRNGVTVSTGSTGTAPHASSGTSSLSAGTTYTYTLTVSDSARGRASKTVQKTITAPAEPTITAAKGAACGGDGTTCAGASVPCSSTCWYITAFASNFASSATCGAFLADGTPIGTTWSQSNGAKQTQSWAGPGTTFYVACGNGARSGTYTF
ncbi:hypothetical protein [Nocardioides sp.]|uniref:fibronectin type III domain-containing protein n=1 Tax=Nocardioides sp. TaxID=35761 RepID=UPI002B823C90|nr:hypothetical protein [Nocardioides sp.]HSX67378.1 hypothetical protein [Nocardioides sp.]